MKPIKFVNNQFIAERTMFNKAIFGTNHVSAVLSEFGTNYKLPYYDFNAVLDDFSVEISAPPGYNNIYLQTDSGRQVGNDVYFLYTKFNVTKFGNKRFANNFDDIIEPTEIATVKAEMGNRPDDKQKFTTDTYNPFANSKKKNFPNTTRMRLVGAERN
jgi:hypothetical protein